MNTTSTPGETYHIGGLSPKSRIVALLLAWFLGVFGVHRMYAGKVGSGVAQLLISCTLIGLIVTIPWAFIDLILIAAGSFRDGEGFLIRSWEAKQ
jgi:TM2 domain-containing membrane protein YozV